MSSIRTLPPILVPITAGAIAVLLGALLAPEAWAERAALPGAGPGRVEHLRDGAALLRLMLMLAGATLIAAPIGLMLCRPDDTSTPALHEPAPSAPRFFEPLLLLLGLAIRMPRLSESLWYDEIVGLSFAGREPVQIVSTLHDPANHILHSLLVHVSLHAPCSLEWSTRLPALLASLLTISIMMRLARPFGLVTMTAAGALTAFLPVMVLEGAEARGYSMMICSAAWSTLLLRAAMRTRQPLIWCAYAIVTALGIWAHLMTVWISIGHAIALTIMLIAQRNWRALTAVHITIMLSAVLTLTLYAPSIGDLLQSKRDAIFAQRAETPTLFGVEGLHMLLQAGGIWHRAFAWPFIALTMAGLAIALRDPVRRTTIVLLWAGLPVMLLVTLVLDVWIYARFALFMMPGVILAMALAVDAVTRRLVGTAPASRRTTIACLAAVGIALIPAGLDRRRPPKQPLRDAVALVQRESTTTPDVLVIGLAHRVLGIYRDDMTFTYSLAHGVNLDDVLHEGAYGWAIVYYPDAVAAERYERLDAAGFEIAARFDGWVDWGRGDVVVMRRQTPGEQRLPAE